MKYVVFVPTYAEAEAIFPEGCRKIIDGFQGISVRDHFIYVSGIGKVNTAITLTRYITKYGNNSTPILIGIGGAYKAGSLAIGDIAIITQDHFVDEALFTKFDNKIAIRGTHTAGFPICTNNSVTFSTPDEFSSIARCTANTVSLLSGTDELAELYHQNTSATVESMEGAAFGLVSEQFGIKAVQVRAVSNYCGINQQWHVKKAFSSLLRFANKYLLDHS